MTSARRTSFNYGLQRARALAEEHGRPLLVLEALTCSYPYASPRFHRFIIQGLVDNGARFRKAGVLYYPYVEPSVGHGRGLLAALARHAVLVVADQSPMPFLRGLVPNALRTLGVRAEVADSNGLLPLRSTTRPYLRAFDFRRFLQRNLGTALGHVPLEDPLCGMGGQARARVPEEILRRWPPATDELLRGVPEALGRLPLDHSVGVVDRQGGAEQGLRALDRFFSGPLDA